MSEWTPWQMFFYYTECNVYNPLANTKVILSYVITAENKSLLFLTNLSCGNNILVLWMLIDSQTENIISVFQIEALSS